MQIASILGDVNVALALVQEDAYLLDVLCEHLAKSTSSITSAIQSAPKIVQMHSSLKFLFSIL